MKSSPGRGLRSFASDLPSSSALFPSPFSVECCIAQEATQHNVPQFVALSAYPECLPVLYNVHPQHTAMSAWQKRWKHRGERGDFLFPADSLQPEIS